MPYAVAVEHILHRLPERARSAYTALVTHPQSRFDALTGCSCAYITQAQLAEEMGCSLRTAKRAVADLQDVGVVRVLAWAGATTEVIVRVTDIVFDSAFGPVQLHLASLTADELADRAIRLLINQWAAFDEELSQTGTAD